MSKLPFGISDSDIDVEVRAELSRSCRLLLTILETPIDIDDNCKDEQKIRELQLKQAAGAPGREEGRTTTVILSIQTRQGPR